MHIHLNYLSFMAIGELAVVAKEEVFSLQLSSAMEFILFSLVLIIAGTMTKEECFVKEWLELASSLVWVSKTLSDFIQ